MEQGTFIDRAYQAVIRIPYGRVATYGQVAFFIEAPRSTRQVGNVLSRAPSFLSLPCRQVVNRLGRMAPGWTEQHRLLEGGGISSRGDGTVDFVRGPWGLEERSSCRSHKLMISFPVVGSKRSMYLYQAVLMEKKTHKRTGYEKVSPEMRGKDRISSPEDVELLLQKGEYGALSTMGEEYPYGVPVNYVHEDGAIYIRCAIVGNKLGNIIRSPKASLCVVSATQVLPGDFITNYESTVLPGKAGEVSAEEKQRAMELLVQKYSPRSVQKGPDYIRNADSRVKIIKITADHLTGKSRK